MSVTPLSVVPSTATELHGYALGIDIGVTGAIAVFTVSNNRSNSASLIALSGFLERTISKAVCFRIE